MLVDSITAQAITAIDPIMNITSDTITIRKTDRVLSKYENNKIIGYQVIVPNKVIEVYFKDDQKEKLVCHEEDTFDLRKGLFLAIAKHLYKDIYTLEGIEAKAVEIGYTKKYVKMVDHIIKEYNREKKANEEFFNKAKENRRIAHEKRMKNDTRKRERKIEIQKEAYLRAMREFQEEKRSASCE